MSHGQFGYNSGEPRADEMVLKARGEHEIIWGMRIDLKSKFWNLPMFTYWEIQDDPAKETKKEYP